MSFHVRRVDYFNTTVRDQPGEGHRFLVQLAELGINMVAFTTIPVGPTSTQLTIFPDDSHKMASLGERSGIPLDGPHPAILVQGDDKLGALVAVHEQLLGANVNVYASSGVSTGTGSYGYILYIRREEYERAVAALGI